MAQDGNSVVRLGRGVVVSVKLRGAEGGGGVFVSPELGNSFGKDLQQWVPGGFPQGLL